MTMKTPISFEFFPPKTEEGAVKLQQVHAELSTLKPEFFSVTYGAGGSTQERTINTVLDLNAKGISTAPHLSCIGSTTALLKGLLNRYQAHGINRIVALRGDLPSGMGGGTGGDFNHAIDLVAFIRKEYGDAFHLEVAAYPEMHPQAGSIEKDIQHFVAKAKAGADSAITQYFYNADAYFHFVDRIRAIGCDIPIIPGIMPITNYSNLARFSDACGAEIPRWMRKQLEAYGDDSASIKAFGLDVVSRLCEQLIAGGAPALHFYSMNQTAASKAICDRLGLSPN
ncbi:methylenetetrahydrofolate reductase [NAD(P)H] [Salinispirillum marinum]|uniref:Methylenetetrahydrofolate reductase n=2 Tax=Saccharospirillaceae TaxID=255527 RepID=A0ABV8BEN9_9GAMM